ncbi:hypothetical protein LEN26_002824 [Aphanomyces euteiches]|nr:hypothetical protein LEN26_002824 [Aphanomyces euteiches]
MSQRVTRSKQKAEEGLEHTKATTSSRKVPLKAQPSLKKQPKKPTNPSPTTPTKISSDGSQDLAEGVDAYEIDLSLVKPGPPQAGATFSDGHAANVHFEIEVKDEDGVRTKVVEVAVMRENDEDQYYFVAVKHALLYQYGEYIIDGPSSFKDAEAAYRKMIYVKTIEENVVSRRQQDVRIGRRPSPRRVLFLHNDAQNQRIS